MERLFKKYYLYIVLIFVVIITGILFIASSYYSSLIEVTKDFSSIDLDKVDKLMIVSHPSDETIFGGAHLLKDDYLVVCITCGIDKKTTENFVDVMQLTQDQYIILGYEEYSNNERSNWTDTKKDIREDLKTIINLKEWSTIVTHNPEGEYGSLQHRITSKIVTSLAPKKQLYYFGKYYTKKTILNHYSELSQINQNILNQKYKLIGTYKNENYIQTEFNHIYEYEDWIKYEEWSK